MILVCGCHRSGTSLTSQYLKAAGLDFGPTDLMDGVHFSARSAENPHGFLEFVPLSKINRFILGESKEFPGDISEGKSSGYETEARGILNQWPTINAFKDPRTTINLPFWFRAFRGKIKGIVKTYRPVEEIARSISKRGDCSYVKAVGIADMYEYKFWTDIAVMAGDAPKVYVASHRQLYDDPTAAVRGLSSFMSSVGLYPKMKIEVALDKDGRHHNLVRPTGEWWKANNISRSYYANAPAVIA